MASLCPQCKTRIIPGALMCINCQRPVDPEPGAAAAAQPTPPPYAAPPPYGAPPQPYGAPPQGPPPPPYGAPPGDPAAGPPQQYVGPVPYSPGYYPVGPTPWSTNGLSIASLVLSLLWLGGLGSLLGVIFGHVSRGQIRKRPQRGGGMAMAGLIIGYVGFVGAVVFWASLPRIIDSNPVQDLLIQQDINGAANAEGDYFHDYGTYTSSGNDLRNENFEPLGRNTIEVAFASGTGFCIVGAHDGSDTWYVYDSDDNGLSDTTYPSESLAQSTCTVPGVGTYEPIN